MPDAIYFKDAQGRFIRVNETMAARLGLKSASEAMGKTVFELPDHAAAVAMYQTDEVVLRTGQAQHYSLERRVSADGGRGVGRRQPLAAARPRRTASWASSASSAT